MNTNRKKKMNRSRFSSQIVFHLTVIVTSLFLCQTTHAVTFSVTPTNVNNTYTGIITLQISGLTNGEQVAVHKYLDVNGIGVIKSNDLMVQNFKITDGQATIIGGITNMNVPFDSTPTDGSIIAHVSFTAGGVAQQMVGPYIYELTSPTGHFSPITSAFTVTPSSSAQSLSGSVVCNGTPVPNSGVLLFTPPSASGGMTFVAGTAANSSGDFTVNVPAGTYLLWAFHAGYLIDIARAPLITLRPNTTITTNVNLLASTQTIVGQFVNASNASGIGGILAPIQSADHQFITVSFTDTNGNFTAGVTPNTWKIGTDSQSVALHGFVDFQQKTTVDTTSGSVTGIVISLHKANALFYGSVTDNYGSPIVGETVYADDNSDQYEGTGRTDTNGTYYAAAYAPGGISSGWLINPDNSNPAFIDDVFSESSTNINNSQAIQLNFVGILSTNFISGDVTDVNGHPITNINVYAYAGIEANQYNLNSITDTNGHYSFNVVNGNWKVGVCWGGTDCLATNFYQSVSEQSANISNNNAVVNFTVDFLQPAIITVQASPRTGGSVSGSGAYEAGSSQQLNAIANSGWIFTGWSDGNNSNPRNITVPLTNITFTANFSQQPKLVNTPTINPNGGTFTNSHTVTLSDTTTGVKIYYTTNGVMPTSSSLAYKNKAITLTHSVTVQVIAYKGTNASLVATAGFTIIVPPAPVIATTSLTNATAKQPYSSTLQVTHGTGNGTLKWSLASGKLPTGLKLSASGVISGTPTKATTTPASFTVKVTDAKKQFATQSLTLTVEN